jgi:hypothetical protein
MFISLLITVFLIRIFNAYPTTSLRNFICTTSDNVHVAKLCNVMIAIVLYNLTCVSFLTFLLSTLLTSSPRGAGSYFVLGKAVGAWS